MEKEKKEVKSEEDVLLRGANGERGALNVRGVLMGDLILVLSGPFHVLIVCLPITLITSLCSHKADKEDGRQMSPSTRLRAPHKGQN